MSRFKIKPAKRFEVAIRTTDGKHYIWNADFSSRRRARKKADELIIHNEHIAEARVYVAKHAITKD